jgi:hypothetical protein
VEVVDEIQGIHSGSVQDHQNGGGSMSYTQARVACTCSHDFQDKTYGRGVRVANLVNKAKGGVPKGQAVVRCTVCSKEQTISEGRLK